MASVKGPLMSLDASGSIADTITFSKWKGRNYVRQLVIPANPKSGLQVGVRSAFKFITQIWSTLSAGIQANWEELAAPDSITPLDAMVRYDQIRARQFFGMKQDPTFAEGAVEAAPAGPAATAQPKSLALAWTDSIGADDWCTEVFMLAGGVVTPSPANRIAIVPAGVQALQVLGLTTGIVYHFKLRGNETGGTGGTQTADFTGTPT